MSDTTRTLAQRLSAISADVQKGIKPTGKTAQKEPTLSITDVEDAISPLLIKHGVIAGYSFLAPPTVQVVDRGMRTDRQTGEVRDSREVLWLVDIEVFFESTDDGHERLICRACDVGSTPSAAVSFALKRVYRALFHLSDEDGVTSSDVSQRRDEKHARGGAREETRPAASGAARDKTEESVGPAPSSASTPSAPDVPDRIARTNALARLNMAFAGSGLTAADLRSKAKEIFGKEKSDDLTAEELVLLAQEVEGLKLSTTGAGS